jgi:hypothetical protein
MSNSIVASDSQNEKPSTNSVAQKPPKSLVLQGDSIPAQVIEPERPDNSVCSRDEGQKFNLWSRFSPISFLIMALISLGCFGLLPFFTLRPDKCGRFSFGLTLYHVGETRAEYDGQCLGQPSEPDLVNPLN